MNAFIWVMVASYAPRGCRVTYQDIKRCWKTPVESEELVADHATIPHVVAVDSPFHMKYVSLTCYKKLSSDKPMCSILCSTAVAGVLAPLAVTWMFLKVWKSIIPHLKEGNWGYLLIKNQDYCPTDSYFMIIF